MIRLFASLFVTALLAGCAAGGAPPVQEARPNVLLITVDDMNWDAPGAFGSPVDDVTPNIDRLAAEGMRFDRGHVTIAVCQPSRSVLMTGRYPHRNGARGFGPIDDGIPTLPALLRDEGYLPGILGKVKHLMPLEAYDWEMAHWQDEMGLGRDPQRYYRDAKTFIERAQQEGRPFFLMANSHDPHRPFAGSLQEAERYGDRRDEYPDPSRTYRPDEVPVPGFLPELPDVRTEIAEYYSSVRRADDFVGAVLRALEETGTADDTIVMFLSDNGMALPFAKTNVYLNSTKTPWIVRWPGRVEAGTVDAAHYVSGIDYLPTIFDALGLAPPEGIDGRSFLPLLEGRRQEGRGEVFTVFHETSGERAYEMRARQDGRFGYIFNAWADGETRFRNESQNGLTMDAMIRAAEHDPEVAERVELFLYRVPEELYDLERDPDALHNLAGDPQYRDELQAMRAEMVAWMEDVDDDLLAEYRAHLDEATADAGRTP